MKSVSAGAGLMKDNPTSDSNHARVMLHVRPQQGCLMAIFSRGKRFKEVRGRLNRCERLVHHGSQKHA